MRGKFKFIGWLLMSYIIFIPRRISNLLIHFFKFRLPIRFHIWILELVFLFLDLIFIPEILQIIYEFFNWHLRPLSKEEKQLLLPVFGKSIPYHFVRINDRSFIAKKMNIAFVSFNLIHYSQEIAPAILVHETVHIWQYHRFGSVYIIRSLLAQRSKEGYQYGGPSQLYIDQKKGLNLLDYNFEQMGDIIRDAYIFNSSLKYPNIQQLYYRYINFIKNS